MFNNIRLSYLDELENDPEVMGSISEPINVLNRSINTTDEFYNAMIPLFGKSIKKITYRMHSSEPWQKEGILLDPKEVHAKPDYWKRDGIRSDLENAPMNGVLLINKPGNYRLQDRFSDDIGGGYQVAFDYNNNLIICGTHDQIKETLKKFGVNVEDF